MTVTSDNHRLTVIPAYVHTSIVFFVLRDKHGNTESWD